MQVSRQLGGGLHQLGRQPVRQPHLPPGPHPGAQDLHLPPLRRPAGLLLRLRLPLPAGDEGADSGGDQPAPGVPGLEEQKILLSAQYYIRIKVLFYSREMFIVCFITK